MITSLKNQQAKNIVLLNTKAKIRKEQGLFVAEGWKMFLEAPADYLYKVFATEAFFKEHKSKILEKVTDVEIVKDEIFVRMSDTRTPQGILCLVRQKEYRLEDLLNERNTNLMLVENLQDPGNLGTIIRTGEGAGITGVIMSRQTVDIYNPKTIRATMGSVYRVPFLYTDDLMGMIQNLKKRGITVYASHLSGTLEYDEMNYRKAGAFLIGNEGNGLSTEAAQSADFYIRIPMSGHVESLNAAVAAAILMYEVKRQRRN